MAESVTVEHGGQTVTTNTMSEADLRTEMEAPNPTDTRPEPDPHATETPAQAAQRARDDRGRFARAEPATPPAEVGDAPEATEVETPARRAEDKLPRHDRIARMQQAVAQKAEADRKAAEAERRAAALEAELRRITQPASTPPTPATTGSGTSTEPQFEQFADQADPYTAYLQAWARWDRAQALAQARAEWEAEHTQKARAQTFQTRVSEGAKAYADFDKVLTEADTLGLQVSAVMQEAIADSPKAADLVYYLATHPEECIQLAEESQQTPVAAATVMRRLLESHLAPHAAPVKNGSGAAARAAQSTAKPPVSPVGSSPVVSDEPPGETASAAEHARYWNRRLKVPGTK